MIEVDITSCFPDHFPLYAAVGIEEVWRYDGHVVRFHRLQEGAYRVIERSIVLPPLTATQATIFVEQSRHQRAGEWERAVSQWVRGRIISPETEGSVQ